MNQPNPRVKKNTCVSSQVSHTKLQLGPPSRANKFHRENKTPAQIAYEAEHLKSFCLDVLGLYISHVTLHQHTWLKILTSSPSKILFRWVTTWLKANLQKKVVSHQLHRDREDLGALNPFLFNLIRKGFNPLHFLVNRTSPQG